MMILPIACSLAPVALGVAVLAYYKPLRNGPDATVRVEEWGTVDGKPAHLWTLDNGSGMTMKVADWGTIITELDVRDRNGRSVDVVLGRPSLQAYVDRTQYFGCTAGCNNGPNALHGGSKGFDKRLWKGEATVKDGEPRITFTYVSADGEEGFPGTCTAKVTYTLTRTNELALEMQATADRPTCVNLAHHTYWNLGGQGSGAILDHVLRLNADRYTPVDGTMIPTGDIQHVGMTPLDFRAPKAIGRDIAQLPAGKDDPGGYDHNFVVNGTPGTMRTCASVTCPRTGITMTVSSDQPGIQFYSGNFLDGVPGKGNAVYAKHDGFCLETQAFPDSINKQGKAGWPDVVLRPGKTYEHRMVHAFTVQ